jgi:hypothetical protein
MFEIINQFKELMNAKVIKDAEYIVAPGWKRTDPGVMVWYDESVTTYVFHDFEELNSFIKDLNELGIEVRRP